MATERQEGIIEAKRERADKTVDELTDEYLKTEVEIEAISAQAAPKANLLAGLKELIREKVVAAGLDSVGSGGKRWEPRTEPKASISNTTKLKAHLVAEALRPYLADLLGLPEEDFENEIERLKTFLSDANALLYLQPMASRIQSVIDEEAENNLLDIEIKEEIVDGKPVEKQIIKSSRLPHVSVFKHETLSITKSKAKKGRLAATAS